MTSSAEFDCMCDLSLTNEPLQVKEEPNLPVGYTESLTTHRLMKLPGREEKRLQPLDGRPPGTSL